jgi:hypothetical protein
MFRFLFGLILGIAVGYVIAEQQHAEEPPA